MTQNEQESELKSVTETVTKVFADFGIDMEVTKACEGFSYHHIYMAPKNPVRMHEVTSFLEDLRFALGRYVVRIEAPVRNKKEVKVSVLKDDRTNEVLWNDLHEHLLRMDGIAPLTVPLGITEEKDTKLIDLAVLPHLIVGGRTLTGKSNFVHGVINSLILRHGADTLRLILVDPKNDSLLAYKGLPHLLTEPIDNSEKTIKALSWACKEMERRYDVLESARVESLEEYHRTLPVSGNKAETLPYIVIVIDEIADVMSDRGDEAEKLMCRLAMMSRGVGLHMVLTTASHEPRILRSMLRAHVGSAMSFSVDSKAASEAFVYRDGAEELMGRGVSLFTTPDEFPPIEIQTGLITNEEIKKNVLKVKQRYGAVDENNIDLQTLIDYRLTVFAFEEEDDMYEEAKKAVIEAGKASTSYLQRKLRIGYSRAARLIDLLEERGVVGPADGSAPREILED